MPMVMKVQQQTVRKLRRLYRETWNRDWPFDNKYLQELWDESNPNHVRGPAAKICFDTCLIAMRECHEF
jgi:hypothetical protein